MKKLMILGGSRYALPVIRAAHDLGVYVITCDYLPDNIAHRYSDEYINVSIIDKNAVLCAAQKLEIDGITSFACDPGVVPAAYVADRMGLPSCGPYDSVCILQNKGRFRRFLTENGFTVPMARSYRNVEDALRDADDFPWPVIVKPTDSAGSKGVTKVETPDKLRESIEFAKDHSFGGEFIVEQFIEKHGYSSDTDSFSVDGELKFVSFCRQYFDVLAKNPYAPAAYSWPSSMTAAHEQELTAELQRLLHLLKMGSSVYNIETREGTDGKAYIMECTPRGGGNRLSEMLRYATGVDMIRATVQAALGMTVTGIEQKPYQGCWAELILHADRSGVFNGLQIAEEIKPCVVETDLWIGPGDAVEGFAAANNALGTLVLRFEQESEMQRVLNDVPRYVSIKLR